MGRVRERGKAKRSRAEQGRLAIMNVPMNFMRTNLLRYWENYFLKKPFRPVVHGECNTTTRIHNSLNSLCSANDGWKGGEYGPDRG